MGKKGLLYRAAVCATLLVGGAGSLRAQGTLSATALNPLTEATTLYKLQFRSALPIDSGAGFVLDFPPGFDVSQVKVAASSTILGGLTVRVRENRVLVLSKGTGPLIPSGRSVDLWLSAVRNPDGAGSNTIALEEYSDGKRAVRRFESSANNVRPAARLVGDVALRLAPKR